MSPTRPRMERPELFFVPTLVDGRLLETDLELSEDLSRGYRITLFAGLRPETPLPADMVLRDPLWLRPLLMKRPRGMHVLYLLRADAIEVGGPLLACQRYPGVVLHRGGGLLGAYLRLYLWRDDTPDFALELGRQLGAEAPGVFERIRLGLPSRATEDRAWLLGTVAERSLAVVTSEPRAMAELEAIGAPNRRLLRAASYTLPSESELPARSAFRITLFGERVPEWLVETVVACRDIAGRQGSEIEVLVAEVGPNASRRTLETARVVRPSIRLLTESDAVVAVPESPNGRSSAALATCLVHGSVTVAPSSGQEPDLQGAFVRLRRWPDCAAELCAALARLVAAPRVREMLSRAGRACAPMFPTREQQALELTGLLERCAFLRPERPEPLRVWRDVLGTRTAELESMSLRPPDPETVGRGIEAALQMEGRAGGEP
jgi:hypothetical protein